MTVELPYEVIFFCDGLDKADLPIRIGPVIFKWSAVSASGELLDILRKVFGDSFRQEWFESGFPGAHVEVMSVSYDEAVRAGSRSVDTAVDALLLKEPRPHAEFQIGVPKTPRTLPAVLVIDKGKSPAIAPMAYLQDQIGTIVIGNLDDPTPELNSKLSSALLDRLPGELFSGDWDRATEVVQRMRRALHWMGVARANVDPASRFIMMWTALESLVGCREDPKNQKGHLIKGRLSALCRAHGGDTPKAELIERLWNLRCEVFHEATMGFFDPGSSLGLDVTLDLRAVQLLLYQAMLYLVEVHGSHATLRAAWDAVAAYTPSTHLDLNDIPLFLRFIHVVRHLA